MENVKQEVAKLVEKYNKLKAENRIRDYNEAQTLSGFIEPLFMCLSWDVHNLEEVTPEENVSGDRVDRAFRINGITKFFLEAKSMRADLDVESYAKQAIKYSWNKGVDYAILTDFEGIKVFYANTRSRTLRDKIIFQISCDNYLSDFEKLWLLSKESFESGKLDKYAEEHFKKAQRLTVNEKLFGDLRKAREILTNSFRNWNRNLEQEILDEGIQRILDRLVFIRVLEDRRLEDTILRPLARDDKKNHEIFQSLISKFRELDKIYNSNLFQEHACEKWENHDLGDFKKVIDLLYGNEEFEYDFKEIPADILGGVYESYLGYIAQNPIKMEAKDGKLFEAEGKKEIKEKSRKKRKEQGIYYTPKFIVDYIVKNTLGEKLKEAKGVNDLKKIKVLDPACGSGSFLTRALEEINAKYKDFGNKGDQYTKTEIILSNIYGVDLDAQATELAKLNLLLDTLERKEKLPNIENIKVGNSLISRSEQELKKYFGKNWRDKKPFDWEEKFPEVFKQGGFDVVIGNPPYINSKELSTDDKKYFDVNYETAEDQYDLYVLFIEKAIKLLKKGGYFSFIVPNKFLITKYGLALRKFIIDNATVAEIKDYSSENVFPDASVYPVVMVLYKEKMQKIVKDKDFNLLKVFNLSNEKTSLIEKLENLDNLVKLNVWRPLATAKEIIEGGNIIITNREIGRYSFVQNRIGNLAKKRDRDVIKSKIIMKKLCYNLEASLDESGFYPVNTTYCITSENGISDLKYILGILNSKLLSYFVRNKYKDTALRGGYIELRVFQIEQLPIKDTSRSQKKLVVDLVNKMISLNKKLQTIPENSDKWNLIKAEIEKTGKEIDQKVYELYGLTEEEIKIIEGK